MVTLTFANGNINQSLAIGDLVYYINNPVNSGGFITGDGSSGSSTSGVSTMIFIGTVAGIGTDNNPSQISTMVPETENTFTVYVDNPNSVTAQSINTLGADDFIFFVKNNEIHLSSMLGYYNSITFKNNSTTKAELYSVSCDIAESSK